MTVEAEGTTMGATDLDELGPVDFAVIEFPEGSANFTGEVQPSLRGWLKPSSSACST
jgi:hypothetical protein